VKSFEYGDQEISHREIQLGIASMILGTGILTLPRLVAEKTLYFDGWICIATAGLFAIAFAWICAKLACRFPKMSYFEYLPRIVTKPVAHVIVLLTAVYFFLILAYVVRGISEVSKRYLFEKTPIEAIALTFLLVVIYAVAGTRAGLLRLNIMFFPITLSVTVFVQVLNIGEIEVEHLRPFFVTPWQDLAMGTLESIYSYLGFSVVLLYISMMNKPSKATKAVVIGMIPPIVLYLLIYAVAIGVFSRTVTAQVIYPTVELAKEARVPGGIFERLESLYFTIWIMTIVNTACMSYDVTIAAVRNLFKKAGKMFVISILSPFIFITAMLPEDLIKYGEMGSLVGYLGIGMEMLLPSLLLAIALIRKVKAQ
jgi:spore germination protein